MAKMTVSFTLDPEEDKRVVCWLDEWPKRERSRAIRQALASYLGQSGITHQDILDAIQELRRCGVTVAQAVDVQEDDPALAEAMANLAKLGL